MATYKVIQDIEAEDKLLGPLTFRQFVYGLVCAGLLFLTWLVVTRGVPFLAPIFLLPALVSGFFAYPWGRDQPTELWALAKIRFMLKPRKRIWDQSGAKELVTVTAPKLMQTQLTDNLSQAEVKSRLRALADTIDSRGWAIKGTTANVFAQPAFAGGVPSDTSDRLLNPAPVMSATVTDDVPAADDMFDEQHNPRAVAMNNLIDASSKARHQKVLQEMNQPQQKPAQNAPARDYWFLNQPTGAASVPDNMVTFNTQVVTPAPSDPATTPTASPPLVTSTPVQNDVNEEQLVRELEAHKEESPMKSYYAHMKKILPPDEQKRVNAQELAAAKAEQEAKARATRQSPPPSPKRQAAINQLAHNNDLNIATIAREAKRQDDEVVINLH